MISELISDDIPPQMTNLNMVIPILMYFFKVLHIKTRYLPQKPLVAWATYIHYVDQLQGTLIMTSGFRQYIAEYTIANF